MGFNKQMTMAGETKCDVTGLLTKSPGTGLQVNSQIHRTFQGKDPNYFFEGEQGSKLLFDRVNHIMKCGMNQSRSQQKRMKISLSLQKCPEHI